MEIKGFTDLKTLLLDNKTVKQTIFKNTFWIALSTGISKFLKAVLLIYVARLMGANEYGKFTFALAFVSLFVVFFDLGLFNIIAREFAREKEKEKEFSSIFSLKILLGMGTLILILIGSFFVTPDPGIRKVIWILAIFSSISNFSEIIYAFFKARQRMEYESWGKILEALMVTGVGFFVIFYFPSIINLSYSYLLSVLVSLVLILTLFHFKVFPLRISWKRAIWKKFLAMSWPLALAILFDTIYVYIDSVMMGFWGQIRETGWYNAAYRIIAFTIIPMSIIAASFFPVLSKFFKESKKKLQEVWNYQMELMIVLALPLMTGGFVFAPKIISFIYGQEFSPSILAFQILTLMAGTIFLYGPFVQILIVSNQQKKFFWTTFLGAITNVILNLILIPKFSLYGAAIATVITYFLVLLLSFGFTIKYTTISPLNLKLFLSLIIVSLSSIIMYFVISRPKIYNLNVFLSISIGVFVYFVGFVALKFGLKHIHKAYSVLKK